MMPPLVCSHFSSHFFRTLQQFRESKYLCDVRLIADGEIEFPAHRLVLAVSSPFFSDLFQSRKDAQDVTTVHLRNCSPDCVQILLQFLYSGELQLKECDPGKVLSVARACRIGTLEQMLANYSINPSSSPSVASPASLQSPSPKQQHQPGAGGDSLVAAESGTSIPAASHTNKRKTKSIAVSSSVAVEQRQQQQASIKTEPRTRTTTTTANKASFPSQQQHQTPSIVTGGSSGAGRLDISMVPSSTTQSSIFMQNAPPTPLCPIHGVFSCGCPLLAMAAASANRGAPGSDPSMAAAIQQLFFGAAAAAAAAQAAEMKERGSNGGGDNNEDIHGLTGYCNSLSKSARMNNNKTSSDTQNGENNCHSPTSQSNQQDAQLFGTSSGTTHNEHSALESQTDTPDSREQQMDRGSMSMVQVPADDKEGWCRNKKYIKKTPQGYQCTVCKKTYGRYNSVSYHVTIYHRNPPIQCDQPGCTFSTREARYIHFHKYYRHDVALPTNIDLESRRCPFCKHVAKSPAMLEKHINRHMPESARVGRTHPCDVCKKDLSSRHALVQHKMIHENEKRLACDQCSYRGRTAENLQQHKLFKHGSGDLWCAKFQCDECQFSAPSKYQLIAHQRNVHGKDEASNGIMENIKTLYSDIEGEDRGESPNENKLIIGEETQNGIKMHSDTDEDELKEVEEELIMEQGVELDEEVIPDEECAIVYSPNRVDEMDAEIDHSGMMEETGGIGTSNVG